jgi:hypothetical protein
MPGFFLRRPRADVPMFTTAWNAIMRYPKFELVAARAKQTGVQLAALAAPEEGPLNEAICADSPNSLMFAPGYSVPRAAKPDTERWSRLQYRPPTN